MDLKNPLKSLLGPQKLNVKARFELLREAISGTMSQVYMARDRQTQEVVALKILDREKTEFFQSRFRGLNKPTEGEIAVRFDHPHIIKTFEHGLTTEGAQYLIMEYLEGPGMNSVLLAHPGLLLGRRVELLRQVAGAIAVVHEAGFIHRDVCPRNLLFAKDLENLKLTDFGLSVPAEKPYMRPGNRTGTPNYMAPELVRRRRTDQRLDVFAFGVTAYEICTGELPWTSGSTGQAAMSHDQPPAPITRHRPGLDPTLAEAIHWCIEPEWEKRCPGLPEFLEKISSVEDEGGRA